MIFRLRRSGFHSPAGVIAAARSLLAPKDMEEKCRESTPALPYVSVSDGAGSARQRASGPPLGLRASLRPVGLETLAAARSLLKEQKIGEKILSTPIWGVFVPLPGGPSRQEPRFAWLRSGQACGPSHNSPECQPATPPTPSGGRTARNAALANYARYKRPIRGLGTGLGSPHRSALPCSAPCAVSQGARGKCR